MKRNRNFLLIVWAASLLGLSAVRTVHAADPTTGFYIPDEFGVFECDSADAGLVNDGNGLRGLLTPNEFKDSITHYNLTSAYKAKLLFLAFVWKPLSDPLLDGLLESTDSAKIKVFVGNTEILPFDRQGRNYLRYSDTVYMIPFGELDSITGRVEVDLSAINQPNRIYEAVVRRGEVDNITALRWIRIKDSLNTKAAGGYLFDKTVGEEDGGKLQHGNFGEVSFKEFDTKTTGWGRVDSLEFKSFDTHSKVHIIKNGTDTIEKTGIKSDTGYNVQYDHIGNEIYRAKIEAGNRYTIAVTARDGVTKGFYHVTLLADTLVPDIESEQVAQDPRRHKLKNIYLYDKDNPTNSYTLIAGKSGKVGFHHDTMEYKVTAPWSSVQVSYDYWAEDSLKKYKEVMVLKYETESNESFIEVRVKVKSGVNEGTLQIGDTTYTIQVLSGDYQLKGLRLSSDVAGRNPIELTRDSAGDYTSATVDYTRVVYAWATPEHARAKIKDLSGETWKKDTATGEFFKRLDVDITYKDGGQQTFTVPVYAEDSVLLTSYLVKVNVKWNPNLDSIAFTWSGQKESEKEAGIFKTDKLAKNSVFDVVIPVGVDIEGDVNVVVKEKDKSYFRMFQTWQTKDTQDGKEYSYIVKVTSRVDGATKTYTFNLSHPSSDATLSYLAVPGFELSPAFDPAILAYTVIVPSELESVTFVTLQNHGEASVAGYGKHTLHGDSTFAIVVTAEDGTTKKTYTVRVTYNSHTGIQLAGGSSVQVYVSDQSLHVSTPAAERVSVYSAGGQLFYSLDKPAGKAFVSTFPKGVLIVKGSSGWVKKVALH